MQRHQMSPEVGLTEKQENHTVVLILLSCWDTGTDYRMSAFPLDLKWEFPNS